MIYAILGAFLSRLHGGGFFHVPKVLNNIIFATPITIALSLMIPNENVWTYSGWLVFCFVVTIVTKATGHGKFFDLGFWKLPAKDEKIEFVIKPLYGKIPEYWYDVLGMTLKGLLTSLGVVIPLLVYAPVLALPVLLGGLFMGVSYMIGWAFFTEEKATEAGEYLSGFFLYLGIWMAL
jgi:hypothetical protein